MLPVTSVLPPTLAQLPGGHAVRDGPRRAERHSADVGKDSTAPPDTELNEPHVLRLLRSAARVLADIIAFEVATGQDHVGENVDAYA